MEPPLDTLVPPLPPSRSRESGGPEPARRAGAAARRVPEITVLFWVTKVLTTAMGESTSDLLVYRINPYLAVALGFIGLVVALVLQFSMRRHVPWVYWLAVVMVAISGTMAADVLHIEFGVPYVVSTVFFATVLAAVFVLWRRTEKTLSIHSVTTWDREAFYWATVMATFALGTAAGDMTATTLHLGYLLSGVVFTLLIAVPALAHRFLHMNAILAFWFAYVVTRPLGASFADWMGKPRTWGALGWGDPPVSLGLTALIVVCVVSLSVTHARAWRGAAPAATG